MGKPVFQRKNRFLWEADPFPPMRVPARVLASEKIWQAIQSDESLNQLVNVATLPGIVKYAIAMPDIHAGYGFPIGGVAAFRMDDGVISPGGVGYDINCGVRVMLTALRVDEIRTHLDRLIETIFQRVPSGVGSEHAIRRLNRQEMRKVIVQGARWAVENGFGGPEDLERCEENGCIPEADPDVISQRAYQRGEKQLGTIGSGNHFVEIDVVDEVYDERSAAQLGLFLDQVVVQIHCGSRGFGHQVCEDFLGLMMRAARRYDISLPDRQLVCAPLSSPEARDYLGAMRGAANYAWANRQIIMHLVRESFMRALDMTAKELGMQLLYDVCHNIAKIEEHRINGKKMRVCVHRKGATRAFGPGRPEVPAAYRDIGQPVLIPGDMGRYSFILIGTPQAMDVSFGSSCHGAGRTMSRRQAKRQARGRSIDAELRRKGIIVRGASRATIDEEMPEAYKDVADVVEVIHQSGISRKVVRLRPLGVVKG